MSRQNTTATISVGDRLPVTLELMGALATSVLGEHTDKIGWCVVSGSAWPCERVVLAGHRPGRDLT